MTAGEPDPAPELLAPPAPADLKPLTEPPSFSVVIPAYQAAGTIADAVGSALEQVHSALDVIVVDDGSTDDLAGALRPFGDRIEVLRKANGGAASARNAGAAAARGEFVAVLDADDRFHPRRLEALARLAVARPDLDLVTTDARFVIDGEAVGTFLGENPFATDDQRRAILRSCFVGGWPAARVSRLDEVGGFDETLLVGHDWDCWLRMILGGSGAGLVNLPYYDYVLGSGGLTSGRVRSLWDRVRLLEKARVNPDLRHDERPFVARELRRRRSEAVREETLEQLDVRISRHRLLRLATLGGIDAHTRAGTALALALPPLARRLIGSRPSPDEQLTEVVR